MGKRRGKKYDIDIDADGLFADLPVEQTPLHLVSPSLPHLASDDNDPFRLTSGQTLALDLRRSRVISASAGTGKTHTLTALYLGLLEGRLTPGGCLLPENEWLELARAGKLNPMRPGEIVAVTFTEKAAAELLERTRTALERELTRDLPDTLKEHLSRCRNELFGAPVSTIHAFCARLLREAGADGPVPAAFTVLEAEEAGELFDDALSSAAAEMLDSGHFPYLQKLAQEGGVFTHRSGLINAGRNLLHALRARGLPASALRPRAATTLEKICQWIVAFYDAIAAVPDKGRSKPKPELRAICAERAVPQTLEAARLLALKIQPLITGAWFENSDIDNPFSRILLACHGPFVDALIAFVERAQLNYAAAKRKAGGVDFDDLMLACKDLLESENARRIKQPLAAAETPSLPARGYRFVLIDEYQDTNPLQRDILFGVAFPDGITTGPARLGIVGDIKQSIYGFRGADVTLMEEACREFAPSSLRENFRSRKKVIECFNSLFAHIWPEGGRFHYGDDHRLEHAGVAARHAWEGAAGEIICWEKDEIGNAERHRQNQAFAIARRIRTLVAPSDNSTLPRPVIWDKSMQAARTEIRYGDIAILARTLKNLRVPLQVAFASLRIPFRILKGMSFFTRQEIVDVTNLWAVACDGTDSFAVAGLLRSPFVGMSDAGLWRLTNAPESHASLAKKILTVASDEKEWAGLSGDDAQALRRAATVLTRLAEWRGRRTAVEILDWALTETGFLSIQALQPRGEEAVAAVRKAIELARGFEARGNRHLSDFVRWMRAHADAEWDDPGASGGQDFSADLPLDDNVVQIGTIHSAKGLEFPIVIFADAGATIPANNDWALYSPEHGLGLRVGSEFDGLKGVADSVHEANVERMKQDENAERLRILYVALTRAMDYLVIVGEVVRSSGETNWRKLIDGFRTVHPDALSEISAKHAELKAATAGDVAGLLAFSNGTAHVREELLQKRSDAPEHAQSSRAKPEPVRELRVSVSRLALWLWCPRRAAFATWETEQDTASRGRELSSQDAEDAQNGVTREFDESEVESGADARALGTAVHAALETFFSADEPLSPETEARAAERFARELKLENAPDIPEVKTAYDRALALARSDWGKRILALSPEERSVEMPFRWRIGTGQNFSNVTLMGQLDLLAKTGPAHWQVVDYKLASVKEKLADSESVTRYAWQAGLYARVAAEILHTRAENVDATLAFLRDESVEPRSVADLGHGRISDDTLKNVVAQFAESVSDANPLDLAAQVWIPAESAPRPRDAAMCEKHRCPFVSRCWGRGKGF